MKSFLNSLRIDFLYVDKYTFSRTWVYPDSIIPYGMLRYILRGRALFLIDGVEVTVHQDEIIYIPQGCHLSCRALEDDFSFISIRFSLSLHLTDADLLAQYFGVRRSTLCEPDRREQVLGYFREVLASAMQDSPAKIFRIQGNLALILAFLSENTTSAPPQEVILHESYTPADLRRRAQKSDLHQDPRIQTVIDYLVLHPEENLQTETLCEMTNLSVTSLRRGFKKHTGKTLGDFLRELRMITAARKILITDERISTIAYGLGFDDPNYFSRSFRAVFGVSPQQYRKSARE